MYSVHNVDQLNKHKSVGSSGIREHQVEGTTPINVTFDHKLVEHNFLKCMYLNADTLTNKMPELNAVVAVQQPHVIVITEVNPKNVGVEGINRALLELCGYKLFVNPRSIEDGRGVHLYVKEEFGGSLCDELCGHGFDESVWWEVKLRNSDSLNVEMFKLECSS